MLQLALYIAAVGAALLRRVPSSLHFRGHATAQVVNAVLWIPALRRDVDGVLEAVDAFHLVSPRLAPLELGRRFQADTFSILHRDVEILQGSLHVGEVRLGVAHGGHH